MNLRVLIGKLPEDTYPVVAGCMDEGTWEVIPEEDCERLWREMKEKWFPDHVVYEWREVRVALDSDVLLRLLEAPTVEGQILTDLSGTSAAQTPNRSDAGGSR